MADSDKPQTVHEAAQAKVHAGEELTHEDVRALEHPAEDASQAKPTAASSKSDG